MAYTDKTGREWNDLDITTMGQRTQAAYAEYRAANQLAAQARDMFEQAACLEMETDLIQFGYKFGKLSFTTDVEKPKAKTSAKGKISLAEFLANARAHNAAA